MNNLLNKNNLKINCSTTKDKNLISKSTIKSIHKDVYPCTIGNPSTCCIYDIGSLQMIFKKEIQDKTIKYLNYKNNNYKPAKKLFKCDNESILNLNSLERKKFQLFKDQGKEEEYLNNTLKTVSNNNNNIIGNNIKDVYCVIDKFFLKKSIIKVSMDKPRNVSSLECMVLFSKALQFVYKEEENYFNNKRRTIGIQKSPFGAYAHGINDIIYTGFSTIIVFDNFIVCSFDIENFIH